MDKRNQMRRLLLSLLLVISISTYTLWLLYQEYRGHRQEVLQTQDSHLFSVIDAVDRGLDIYLNQYCDSLRYVIRRPSFAAAERLYLEQGHRQELAGQMRDSLIVQDPMAKALMVLDHTGKVILSTGASDSTMLGGSETRGPVEISLCRQSDGSFGLVFQTSGADQRLSYRLVLDLETLYHRISSSDDSYDRIMLLDRQQTVMLRTTTCGDIHVIDIHNPASQDAQDAAFLQQLQQATVETTGGAKRAIFFDAPACGQHEAYLARMAIYAPGALENDFFTVCVSMDYEKIAAAQRRNTFRISLYVALLVAALAHLAGNLLRTDRRRQDAQSEIALLRQRNETLAEINRQEQELAHHQRLQTIGTLTSGVAHEFNNLLTPIMGYAIMALEELTDDQGELYDELLEIYQAAQKSKEIVARISSLSGKHMDLTFKPLCLDRVVESVCMVLLPSKPPQVTLRKDLGCGPCRLLGSETHLSQVVLNLCINALHAMEEGGGLLTVRTRVVRDEAGRWAELRVSDTGQGIAPEVLPKIFDPFFTTKPPGKGSGLGLPIVRQILDEHGGTVRAESQPGHGTTLVVRLPVPADAACTDPHPDDLPADAAP